MTKTVVEAFVTDANFSTYVAPNGGFVLTTWKLILDEWGSSEEIVEGIKLLPKTARTNVALKGADGRFISFRDCTSTAIRDAVESLKPFPEV